MSANMIHLGKKKIQVTKYISVLFHSTNLCYKGQAWSGEGRAALAAAAAG